jgi:uncharacterized membrane protein YdjX (TVP38/TMEM64 family)
MKRLRNFLPILVLIALGIALLASGVLNRFRPANLAQEQAHLQELIAQHPFLAFGTYVVAVTLAISTGVPGVVVLILAGGMLFGVWIGTALSIVAVTLGALILFLASRRAFGDHSHARAPGLVERLRGGYLVHPISYTVFLRLVPFFPFGGVTVALAWLRCPMWLFLAATAGGGSFMTGVETALGAGLAKSIGEKQTVSADILTQPGVLLPLVGLGLLALVPVAISKWRTRSAPAAEDERLN